MPIDYKIIRVKCTLGKSIGTMGLYILGIAANIVLLYGAAILLIYVHQELNCLQLIGLDIGEHTVSMRELETCLLASIGFHAFLGISALVAYRSRYCFRFTAVALSIGSWFFWLIGFSIGIAALLHSNEKPFLLKYCYIFGGGVMWAALNTMGAAVFALARRISLKNAARIVDENFGRYFLYLRSFVSDTEKSPDRSSLFYFTALGGLWLPLLLNPFYFVNFRRQNPEEILLLKGVARSYPVVAIGKPGELLPPLGASRIYADHEHWRQVATSLADNSCAVLILPHSTAGVVWEFTELCLRAHPSKAVIILPHSLTSLQWSRAMRVTHHADIWTTFLAALENHPMVHRLPTALPSNALVMTFEDDWSPIVWVGAPISASFSEIARYVALNATPPVATNKG